MEQIGGRVPTLCERCLKKDYTRTVIDKKLCTECFAEELADMAVADRCYFRGYIMGSFDGYLDGTIDGILGLKSRLEEGPES